MARSWTAAAAAFFSASVVACTYLSRSFSSSSSQGQPARALSQLAIRKGVISGSRMSTCDQLVEKAFQPPSDTGTFLARRTITLCQSIEIMSTLKPARSSSAFATGPSCLITPRSVGASRVTGVPSYPASARSAFAFAALPSTSPAMPASVASGEPQVNIALHV